MCLGFYCHYTSITSHRRLIISPDESRDTLVERFVCAITGSREEPYKMTLNS